MKIRNGFLEISTLLQYGVTGLNYQADGSGALKNVTFGQVVRQRVSSQAQKYTLRQEIGRSYGKVTRTKGAYNKTVKTLCSTEEKVDSADAKQLAFGAFAVMEFEVDENGRTGDHLLITDEGISRFVRVILEHRTELVKVKEVEAKTEAQYRKEVAKANKEVMRNRALKHALTDALFGPTTVELALFGRPLFKLPDYALYGAVQVAHAVGVSAAHTVHDHFVTKDDYEQERFATAHRGVSQFMASTLYTYAAIDLPLLIENLNGNVDLAVQCATDVVELILITFPSRRAAETAPYTLPFYTALSAGVNCSPLNLVPAFDKPVWDIDGEQAGAVKALEALLGQNALHVGTPIGAIYCNHLNSPSNGEENRRNTLCKPS